MAYDKEFIEKVGIYYETHDVSAKEVAELFGVSRSNMYNWVEKNGWIQNKYRSVQQSAGGFIDRATLNAVHNEAVESVVGEVIRMDENTNHYDIDRAKKVAGQIVRDVLTLDELKQDASEALRGARDIAMNSNRLGDKRTWLECIKTGQEIIYGKNPDVVVFGDMSKITDVDIANMSTEELVRLSHAAEKNKPKGE